MGKERGAKITVRMLWQLFQSSGTGDILRSSHKMAEGLHTAPLWFPWGQGGGGKGTKDESLLNMP